jgi:hypothetical protein
MKRLFLIAALFALQLYPVAAFYQSRDSNYNVSSGSLPGPPTVTYIGNANGSQSGSVVTYTTYSIGTASGFTTRRIIFVVASNDVAGSATSISSVLINGSISATVHVQALQATNGPFVAIFSADIPTGTTATVAVTYNSTVANGQYMAAYSVDDAKLVSTTPSTGSATGAATTTLTTSSFTQGAGGFTIAAGGTSANPASGYAFTGYTTDAWGGSVEFIFAHLGSIGSSGSTTATATWVSSLNGAIAAASWR